jgi:hypothetical protein
MKLLKRNLKIIWACQYADRVRVPGTNEYRLLYSDPAPYKMNVSAARGTTDEDFFGVGLQYDKTLITNDITCPITETSLLFVDKEPEQNSNGDYLNDFIVKKIAKSINNISYAVERVSTS